MASQPLSCMIKDPYPSPPPPSKGGVVTIQQIINSCQEYWAYWSY